MSDKQKEVGPIFGVELLDRLPFDDCSMFQALPNRRDLVEVKKSKLAGSGRLSSGYEVLLEHYRRAQAENAELRQQLAEAKAVIDKLPKTADGVPVVAGMSLYHSSGEFSTVSEVSIVVVNCGHQIVEHASRYYSTREAAEAARAKGGA